MIGKGLSEVEMFRATFSDNNLQESAPIIIISIINKSGRTHSYVMILRIIKCVNF